MNVQKPFPRLKKPSLNTITTSPTVDVQVHQMGYLKEPVADVRFTIL
jgi:hypothetical protein